MKVGKTKDKWKKHMMTTATKNKKIMKMMSVKMNSTCLRNNATLDSKIPMQLISLHMQDQLLRKRTKQKLVTLYVEKIMSGNKPENALHRENSKKKTGDNRS
jgi:hypothetical protein